MFSYQVDESLKLVLPLEQHAAEIAEVVNANLDHLRPWMPWANKDYSVQTATDFINQNLKRLAEKREFSANIVLNGKIVGNIGFHNLQPKHKWAQMGYWLVQDAQGKGLMTRCCRVLIDYLFDEMNLNRVQIDCNVENEKSRAVPERLGFTLEGIHRQVEFFEGRFGDWAIYAMLKEDWKK